MGDITSGQDVDILSWLGSTVPTVGQKAMASSIPVVIASNQTAVNSYSSKYEQLSALTSTYFVNVGGVGIYGGLQELTFDDAFALKTNTTPETVLYSDTYTGTGSGTSHAAGTDRYAQCFRTWTLHTIPTGAVTSWAINLEGSLDNTNFVLIASASASGAAVFASNQAFRYYRTRCTGMSLGAGTNVKAYVLATT